MTGRQMVASTEDLAENGSRVIAEVGGREVAVFKHDDGYHAVANYCVHQAGPLCEGDLTGCTVPGDDGWEWGYDDEEKYVRCPWHGWTFDVTTGANVHDRRYRVPTYEVEVEDGDVYVLR